MKIETKLRFLLAVCWLLLVLSFLLPYCEVTLAAPGLSAGLHLEAAVGSLGGSADLVPPAAGSLPNRPRIETSSRLAAWLAAGLLALNVIFASRPFAFLLRLPAIFLPAVVVADALPWLEAAARGAALELGRPSAALVTHPGWGGLLAGLAAAMLVASLLLPEYRRARGLAERLGRRPAGAAGERRFVPFGAALAVAALVRAAIECRPCEEAGPCP